MKTFRNIILLTCAIIILGCKDGKKSAPVIEILTDSAAVDSTVYGRCGEGTAMHTLELITDKGDTIVYTLEGLDTFSNVQGGLIFRYSAGVRHRSSRPAGPGRQHPYRGAAIRRWE